MSKKGLRIVTDDDFTLISAQLPDIVLKAKQVCAEKLEPTIDEVRAIYDHIKEHIRKHKRIIYGGYAQNSAIKLINPEEVFYKYEWDIPDIEFYSNDPLTDIKILCHSLQDAGFKDIQASGAQHDESYKIHVNGRHYADISYVASIAYNNIKTFECEGIKMVHPHVALVDYYRMINDLLSNAWRIEKSFGRMFLLQKHYPLEKFPDKGIKFNIKMSKEKIILMGHVIKEFLPEHLGNIIVCGFETYNHYIQQSGYSEEVVKKKKSNIYYLEYLFLDYNKYVPLLINFMRSKVDNPKDISFVEHYPFFQYYGDWCEIFYKDILIARLFHYGEQCVPYHYVQFKHGSEIREKKIATLDYMVMTSLMHKFKSYIDKVEENKNHYFSYHTLATNLIEARDNYLEKTGKSIVDKHIFRMMTIRCIGYTITMERRFRNKIKERKAKGKPLVFRYEPTEKNKEEKLEWNFSNSSGNAISNIAKLRFIEKDSIVYFKKDAEEIDISEESMMSTEDD